MLLDIGRCPLIKVRLPTSPCVKVPMLALHASIPTLTPIIGDICEDESIVTEHYVVISKRAAQTRLLARKVNDTMSCTIAATGKAFCL